MSEGEKEPLLVKCECSSHMLELQRYDYGAMKDTDKVDDGFYVSVWAYQGNINELPWKERIRWCWRLLTKGNLWADNIILTNQKAKEVSQYITQYLPKK